MNDDRVCANSQPSQCDRLMTALRLNGSLGITQADFSPPNVIDGFAPIPRLAARVDDLKKRGVDVVRDGTRQGFAVYKLATAETPPPAAPQVPASPTDSGVLFDAPAARPANALLGES